MRKAFSNSNHVQCIFTDESVTFYGDEQAVCLPYGCIDEIKMSLLGVLQATSHTRICSFTVDHRDRAEVKEMVKYVRKAMTTAPKAELQVIDLVAKDEKNAVPNDLPPEEQLKMYKAQFVQGIISKEEYDAKKLQLKG